MLIFISKCWVSSPFLGDQFGLDHLLCLCVALLSYSIENSERSLKRVKKLTWAFERRKVPAKGQITLTCKVCPEQPLERRAGGESRRSPEGRRGEQSPLGSGHRQRVPWGDAGTLLWEHLESSPWQQVTQEPGGHRVAVRTVQHPTCNKGERPFGERPCKVFCHTLHLLILTKSVPHQQNQKRLLKRAAAEHPSALPSWTSCLRT